jgi:hypothetical protein
LILQGDQGFQKSSFFKVLAGGIYFDDSLGAVSDKDERLKLHRAWFIEWAELETIFSRKDVSATKAFLSSSVDALRPPYHRDIEDFPRASIICGSTNRNEFLSDETGNRRFWVIPVEKKVDVDLLSQERDAIWAAAVLAYKSGEQWWLTPEEETLLAQANQGWLATDSWEVAILNYLDNKSTCTIAELLEKTIGLELAKQSKSEQMRVSNILRRNGWARIRKQVGNKRDWFWEKVRQEVGQASNSLPIKGLTESNNEVRQEVRQASNSLPTSILDNAASPASPTSLNFSKNQENSSLNADIALSTNTMSESSVKFGVRSEAGEAAQFETSKTLAGQGLEAATPPATPPASPLANNEVWQQNKRPHHKEFEVGNQVVVTIEGLHNGVKGKITGKRYLGRTHIRYDIKLDKPSHSLTEIFVEVPIEAKRTYLIDANVSPRQV